MAGIAIEIKDEGFEEALAGIEGIEKLEQSEVLDRLGRLFQHSTRGRIDVTKTAPDGSQWQANRRGTSILRESGNLSGSIDYKVGSSQVAIGSALVYARIHQLGGEIKPKNGKHLVFTVGNQLVFAPKVNIRERPYLGVSNDDSRDALDMVADTIAELFQ